MTGSLRLADKAIVYRIDKNKVCITQGMAFSIL